MLKIGSRKSALAQKQTEIVRALLSNVGIETSLVLVESEGDLDLQRPLYEMETTPGVFVRHLETSLRKHQIDLAVHSLKDMPIKTPEDLPILAIPEREDASDVLMLRNDAVDPSQPLSIRKLATIGTSSLRREALIRRAASQVKVEPIRGNVLTRIQKVRDGHFDGVVLAAAGLKRLGAHFNDLSILTLDPEIFVPAPGQGALAIQARAGLSSHLAEGIKKLHSPRSEFTTTVERGLLARLGGGCSLPLGVHCRSVGERYEAYAFYAKPTSSADGRTWQIAKHARADGEGTEAIIEQLFQIVSVISGERCNPATSGV